MLTDEDKQIIDLAKEHPRWSGAMDAAIMDELGMTSAAFFQRLIHLSRRPEAIEYDPVTMNRVRGWRG